VPDGRNIYVRKGSVRDMPGGESQKGYEEEEDEEELPSSWYLIHRSSTSVDAHGRSKLCMLCLATTSVQFRTYSFQQPPQMYILCFLVRSERTRVSNLIKSIRAEK